MAPHSISLKDERGLSDVVQHYLAADQPPAVLGDVALLMATIAAWISHDACLHYTSETHEVVEALRAPQTPSNYKSVCRTLE
ncbi:hypothetical protein MRX96_000434 [Rhipicephalus microplus]